MQENRKPDEFTYASLLEGCVVERCLADGMRLLDEMRREGVSPSNSTLSIVIKLLGRFRRLEQAFRVAEEVSQQYDLTPNIQVYLCRGMGHR